MTAQLLMIQGTASHVGKSVLAAAFCRLLHRQGIRTAPFKAVNMSNNAFVTPSGEEIAYAQAVQAKACGIAPQVEMNPVLLKPTGETTSDLVVLGRSRGVIPVEGYPPLREDLAQVIREALQRLLAHFDAVVLEGAGSPAEVNLKDRDLANMWVAAQVDAPVILVGDIERGGVFAQLVGTLELLSPEDRARVKGFLINKFRGDRQLLEPGCRWLTQRTGIPVLGVIPWVESLGLPQEDSLDERLEDSRPRDRSNASGSVRIQVIRYPTISNATDLEPLHHEPGVSVEYLTQPPEGEFPDWVILPGSKNTMSDLSWMRKVGLDRYLASCAQAQVEILGICGGFQMLGERIYDPGHVESPQEVMEGLGLLPTHTLFLSSKVTTQVSGIHLESRHPVRGYEIHMGRLQGAKKGLPVFKISERSGNPVEDWDGCRLPDRPIWGTYLHGLFDQNQFRRHTLSRFRRPAHRQASPGNSQDPLDRWADLVWSHLDRDAFLKEFPWIRSL